MPWACKRVMRELTSSQSNVIFVMCLLLSREACPFPTQLARIPAAIDRVFQSHVSHHPSCHSVLPFHSASKSMFQSHVSHHPSCHPLFSSKDILLSKVSIFYIHPPT